MRYAFEGYVLDTDRRELLNAKSAISTQPQVFDLLAHLIRNRDRVVSKEDLLATIWGGRIVSESTLASRINAARSAIGDDGDSQRLIRTLPRRGYRFIAPVIPGDEGDLAGGAGWTVVPASDITAAQPGATTQTLRVQAERRQLTIMACEFVVPATRCADMTLDDLRDVIGAFHRRVADTATQFSGFVGHSVDKTVLVYFGYPVAHEEDTERAVRAALEVCTTEERLRPDWPSQSRAGVATGQVIVGDLEGALPGTNAFVGEAPSIALRLQNAAPPGTVLIDADTRQLVGSLFDCTAVEPINSLGTAQTLRAWQALRSSGVESRFEALRSVPLAPLVGRDEELELLLRRWALAKAGNGRVVLLSGEPGIGKSRLAAALQHRLEAEPHAALHYFCSPIHRDSALLPITTQIQRAANLEAKDVAETKIDKLEKRFASTCTCEDIAIIADLLAVPGGERYPRLELTPQRKRERTFEVLLRLAENLTKQQPLLMVFEDLHWADPTSVEFLDRTVEQTTCLPMLLVATCRPEVSVSWTGLAHVTTLFLNRLAERDGATLIEQIDGGASLPREVVGTIIQRTDGIPLFIEEMTKAVLELRDRDPSRAISVTPPAVPSVPTSLQNALMARLDHLSHGRFVAQVGAAVGRQFSFELVSALSLLPSELLRLGLQELVDAQLVFCRGVPPNAEYTFKHALVQDIAYESLLKDRRVEIHRRIAETLQNSFTCDCRGATRTGCASSDSG